MIYNHAYQCQELFDLFFKSFFFTPNLPLRMRIIDIIDLTSRSFFKK